MGPAPVARPAASGTCRRARAEQDGDGVTDQFSDDEIGVTVAVHVRRRDGNWDRLRCEGLLCLERAVPLPSRTETVLLLIFATIRSALQMPPFTSAAVTE